MKAQFYQQILVILLALLCCGCLVKPPKKEETKINAFEKKQHVNATNQIRLAAIRQTATRIGAQGGLAWRSTQIDSMLKNNSEQLDRVFNFRALILKNNVMPPVLSEADNTMKLNNDAKAIRLADKTYSIIIPPHFITAPPTWRQYIWLQFKPPEPPDETLLPKNEEERHLWNRYVKTGWEEGIRQANQIFATNLNRLRRDVNGMILYRKLLAQNIVTPPFVASANLGITGGGKKLRINDEVLRITSTSTLRANSKLWKPIFYNTYGKRNKHQG